MRLLAIAAIGAAAALAWLVWATGRAIEVAVTTERTEEDDIQSDPYLVSQPIGGM